MFSCELCEISKKNLFNRVPPGDCFCIYKFELRPVPGGVVYTTLTFKMYKLQKESDFKLL